MSDKAQIATRQEGGYALQVGALTKRYGEQTALADVAFNEGAGEVLGLIGPNGAGKTTLLEAIAGLLPADSGRILRHGASLPPASRRRSIFFLPDGLRPWRDQYVEHVLAFFADVYRTSHLDVAETVGAVGLAPVLIKRVSELSKGYARRLMLALALITPHPVLLMDEPFDGFDLRQTREIMSVLRKVAAQGRSLVLAIHQLLDAERMCDRFVLLADGRVRGIGSLSDLRARAGISSGGLEEVFLALT
ncbi:ABC transporter ATP-binding protein [Mesorhizobium sp. M0522]|uniref:ABC transporter ATP-binding protein n=1 Tax=Mesorhizobium sp. M0522 TaxID=2956958 RepID=UPI0003CDF873|nr:ABC transporter [Mesorhizobium sp. LSJC280B00]